MLIIEANLILFKVLRKLTTLFKSMGVKAVFDTNSSKDITLIESCKEFVTRYEQSKLKGGENGELSLPMLASSCPGMSLFIYVGLHVSCLFYNYLCKSC